MTVLRLARLTALAAITLAGMTAAAVAASQSATTSGYANLREGPGTKFDVIATLDPDTEVTVNACTGTWCAVETDDDEGFVAKSLLDFDSATDDSSSSDDAEVCFYQGEDFSDANFCVQPGDSDDHIPGSFNNAIESISVSGDVSVEVCTGSNMSGTCKTYDHSVKSLPSSVIDQITSYAVDGGDSGDDSDQSNPNMSITLN